MGRKGPRAHSAIVPDLILAARRSVFPFARMDLLTQVTDDMRFRFRASSESELTAPWSLGFGGVTPAGFRKNAESVGLPFPPFDPPKPQGRMVAVRRGHCWLEVAEHGIRLALGDGDIVFVTRDVPMSLRDDLATPVRHTNEIAGREQIEKGRGLIYGGGGAATYLFAGLFFLAGEEDNPLLSALPPVIHIRGSDPVFGPWMQSIVKLLNHELFNLAPGSQTVINHLAHALFVLAVRAHLASLPSDASGSFIHAVLDPELAPALALMHMHPQETWTVARLAEHSNASRSAFAARFTDKVGRPPLQYLTECRIRIAKSLLRDTKSGMKTILAKVGYANESAFGNAFKRVTGMSPGERPPYICHIGSDDVGQLFSSRISRRRHFSLGIWGRQGDSCSRALHDRIATG
jgi:AraC-like DNA-binding protein